MEQTQPRKTLVFFISVVVLSIIAVVLLVSKCLKDTTTSGDNTEPNNDANTASVSDSPDSNPDNDTIEGIDTRFNATPEELVGYISEVTIKANDTGNAQPLINLLGQKKPF